MHAESPGENGKTSYHLLGRHAGDIEQLNQVEHHWEAGHHCKPEQWEAGLPPWWPLHQQNAPLPLSSHSAGAIASGRRVEKGKFKEESSGMMG